MMIDAAEFYKIEASPSRVVRYSCHRIVILNGLPKSLLAACDVACLPPGNKHKKIFLRRGKNRMFPVKYHNLSPKGSLKNIL